MAVTRKPAPPAAIRVKLAAPRQPFRPAPPAEAPAPVPASRDPEPEPRPAADAAPPVEARSAPIPLGVGENAPSAGDSVAARLEGGLSDGGRGALGGYRGRGLDVVICLDTTSSMGEAIARARVEALSVVSLVATLVPGAWFGLVTYGDEVRTVVPLTADADLITARLFAEKARGGGDSPEAPDLALGLVLDRKGNRLARRGGAHTVILLIGDAPPHPEDEPGALQAIRSARERDPRLAVNAIVCGPYGAGFLERAAGAGGGRAVPLGAAAPLACTMLGLFFGPELSEEVERLAAAHVDELRGRAGSGSGRTTDPRTLARAALGAARAATDDPARRAEALLRALALDPGSDALFTLLELEADHAGALEGDRVLAWLEALAEFEGVEVDAGDPGAFRPLAEDLRRPRVVRALARLAGRLPDRRQRPHLLRILSGASGLPDDVRAEVVVAVFRIEGRETEEAVCRLSQEDPAAAVDVRLLLHALGREQGPKLADAIARRFLRDADARTLTALGRAPVEGQRQAGLAVLERMALEGPPGPPPGPDPWPRVLAALSDRGLFAVLAAAAAGGREREAAALAVGRLAPHLGLERLARLLVDGPIPASRLLEADRDVAGLAERALLSALRGHVRAGRDATVRRLLAKLRALDAATRAEVALALAPTIEGLAGTRRRDAFRFFAEATDERGLDLIVRALRWDRGEHLGEAVDALRRITGKRFRSPAGSARARSDQATEIELWWESYRKSLGPTPSRPDPSRRPRSPTPSRA